MFNKIVLVYGKTNGKQLEGRYFFWLQPCIMENCVYVVQGCTKGRGRWGSCPTRFWQIRRRRRAAAARQRAPHYYLPHRIFDPWCIPATNMNYEYNKFLVFLIFNFFYKEKCSNCSKKVSSRLPNIFFGNKFNAFNYKWKIFLICNRQQLLKMESIKENFRRFLQNSGFQDEFVWNRLNLPDVLFFICKALLISYLLEQQYPFKGD